VLGIAAMMKKAPTKPTHAKQWDHDLDRKTVLTVTGMITIEPRLGLLAESPAS